MREITINTGRRSKIIVGKGVLAASGRHFRFNGKKFCVVTHPEIRRYYGEKVESSLASNGIKVDFYEIESGERSKSINELERLYEFLAGNRYFRNDGLVSLGGGVAGDLTGFAASTYMRGIFLANIPTTLLSQVDSAIGGKNGINLKNGKNLAGTFYQPDVVVADIDLLMTLPEQELRSGIAEVIKYALIEGGSFLSFLEKNMESIVNKEPDLLEEAVFISASVKARIVGEDELDIKGVRSVLNYGHTVGHALETLSGYSGMTHGEAVARGMIAAAWIACLSGHIDREILEKHYRLIESAGLPNDLGGFLPDDIIDKIKLDKKAAEKKQVFILLEDAGKAVEKEIGEELIKQSLSEMIRRTN